MINLVVLEGRLTADATIKQFTDKEKKTREFATWTLAVNYGIKQTLFIECFTFNAIDAIKEYLKKGVLISIEGTLNQKTYSDKAGVKHSIINCCVRSFNFLESKEKKCEDVNKVLQEDKSTVDLPF